MASPAQCSVHRVRGDGYTRMDMYQRLVAIVTGMVLALGLVGFTATSAGAAPVTPTAKSKANKVGWQGKGKSPLNQKKIRQYKLKYRELREIREARAWARGWKPRAVRACESGGNYSINTGNGYYGAYQFAYGTWLGVGGGRYARTANQAPRFAQDHMAWKLWRSQGWGPWGCA